MSTISLKAKFNTLKTDVRRDYIEAAIVMSHIFTLSGRKFKKATDKISAGTMPLMTKYKRGSMHRVYLTYAMTGVVDMPKLTPLMLHRMEWLIDGDNTMITRERKPTRTFDKVGQDAGTVSTHKMGLTNHVELRELSRKAKPLELKLK